jgi:hypothetical protein
LNCNPQIHIRKLALCLVRKVSLNRVSLGAGRIALDSHLYVNVCIFEQCHILNGGQCGWLLHRRLTSEDVHHPCTS